MKIGITSTGYANLRNINYKTDYKYVHLNILNRNSYLNIFSKWLEKIFKSDLSENLNIDSYKGIFFERIFYDIAHFFNTISFSKQSWVTTFETTAPFFRKEIEEYLYSNMNYFAIKNKIKIEKGLQACASDSCKALIALSECAMNMELNLISNFPMYEEKIKSKLIQIYPPQAVFVNYFEEKKIVLEGKLKFMFVGREFYRKGGLEILHCFEKLSKNYDIELILVSSIINDIPHVISENDELVTKTIIKNNSGTWLTHYLELDNENVIELMKSVHVGLLPTYSETFGYSVLEFQACGCPVITTDVRALLEINNENIGWIIPVGDKTAYGEIRELNKLIDKKVIEIALEKIVIGIFNDRTSIIMKANQCIERIKEHHSPESYKNMLVSLYCA